MRWLVLLCLSGCLYLDVINIAPSARIERVGTGAVHVADTIRLSARGSDDEDGDPLSFDWRARATGAPSAFAASGDAEFMVRVPDHRSVTVLLTVLDEHGASAEASLELAVTDRAPDAELQVQTLPGPDGTYTVTRPIVFAAMGTDPDGDTLTYSFELHPPPQSNPDQVMVTRPGDTSFSVVPDVPGLWEVEVVVDDGFGLTATARQSVTVAADQPPCVAATSPAWSPETRVIVPRAAGPRRFAVESVSDDLDGHPGGGIHFRWLVAMPGSAAPVELDGHDLADLVLDPAELDPGDVLGVRVEIEDRVDRTLPCGVEQAACSIAGTSCRQRLTWTVEVR